MNVRNWSKKFTGLTEWKWLYGVDKLRTFIVQSWCNRPTYVPEFDKTVRLVGMEAAVPLDSLEGHTNRHPYMFKICSKYDLEFLEGGFESF